LDKKIFLVTGSTSGIGKETAIQLLKKGHKVIISSEKEKQNIDFSEFQEFDYEYVKINISDKDQVINGATEVINKFGRIDGLVNNAGVMPTPCGIDDISDYVIDQTINTNLKGTFYCLKYLGKAIQESANKGAIVNLTSVDGIIGEPYGVIYSATKAGIISLTKSFARYYNDPLVRVNAVAPGLIDTPLTSSTGEDPFETTEASVIKRMGSPLEIANVIVFLLSNKASFITGRVWAVDGGFLLK